jgi:ABC-2 type transport system ATP-binding protein
MDVAATDLRTPDETTPGAAGEQPADPESSAATARPAPARLELRGVSKRWGERQVLDGVSLELAAGAVIWIGGQNGAGKTTLLRIVAGLIAPDAGTVALDGLDPSAQRSQYQRRLGFLAAGDRGLYARLSVYQNLSLWASLAFVPRAKCDSAAHAAARMFAIEDLLPARADRLSTGQRQRVRLAMAFLHAPMLILLDEPTASLDDEGTETLVRALAQASARGATAIWCSPRPPEPPAFDRAFVIEAGALTASA